MERRRRPAPSDGPGHRQAHRLAEALSRFGPIRAYAAPPLRCPQTLRPLADRLGLSITLEPLLGERGYQHNPHGGLARLLELAAEPGVAVVCSQGAVIPDVISTLTGRLDPPARKASTWVLGLRSGAVLTTDHYPGPKSFYGKLSIPCPASRPRRPAQRRRCP